MKKANVHLKDTDEDGVSVYGIGTWSQQDGQFQAPLDAKTKKLTGCFGEFSPSPIGTMTLEHARREARKLYGYVKTAK